MFNSSVLIFLQSKLFEGLEEDSGLSPDTFVPRKNIKKLVLKPKSSREVGTGSLKNVLYFSVHSTRIRQSLTHSPLW